MPHIDRIEEVLKLIQETGDRCIVLMEGHDPYVIMDIASYRSLLESAAEKQELSKLSEGELLERINQQIAEWREVRKGDLSGYELSSFQVDSAKKSIKRSGVENRKTPDSTNPELPVVEDDASDEYHLEPLA